MRTPLVVTTILICAAPASADAIALSPVDLAAFRKCAEYWPEWSDSLTASAKDHLIESRHVTVVVDDADTWSIASLAMTLSPVPGEAGDFLAVQQMIEDKYFRQVRCFLLLTVPLEIVGDPQCSGDQILSYAFTEAPPPARPGLQEWLGGRLQDMSVEQRLACGIDDEESQRLASLAMERYVQAEYERQRIAAEDGSGDERIASRPFDHPANDLRFLAIEPSIELLDSARSPLIALKAGDFRLYMVPSEGQDGDGTTLHIDGARGRYKMLLGGLGSKSLQPVAVREDVLKRIETALGDRRE